MGVGGFLKSARNSRTSFRRPDGGGEGSQYKGGEEGREEGEGGRGGMFVVHHTFPSRGHSARQHTFARVFDGGEALRLNREQGEREGGRKGGREGGRMGELELE